MKTGKLMKENCSKKTSEIIGIEINDFLSKFLTYSLFAMLTRGHHVQYENVIVQQPLSAGSIISAVCVSVMVVHICDKVVDSKVGR